MNRAITSFIVALGLLASACGGRNGGPDATSTPGDAPDILATETDVRTDSPHPECTDSETISPDVCVPDCTCPDGTPKLCGDDGCGGTCSVCNPSLPGLCTHECGGEPPDCFGLKPDCEGKECGPDGAGGNCGECPAGTECWSGACVCWPDCEGKVVCEPDGCGFVCGTCPPGEACVDGACACVPACEGKECGPDGCGGSCGVCGADGTLCDGWWECGSGKCGCVAGGAPTCGEGLSLTPPCTESGAVCACDAAAGPVCKACGDGDCQEGEDRCSCPNDCAGGLCDGFVPLVPFEVLALTPRPSQIAETFALRVSGAFVAPQPLYERIDADITAGFGDMAGLPAMYLDHSAYECCAVFFKVAEDALAQMVAGDYHAWDCLNWFYHATMVEAHAGSPYVELFLDGCYRKMDLLSQYEALPGIFWGSPNLPVGDGNDACVWLDGEVFHYLFGIAFGDCPAGCGVMDWTYFATDSPGHVVESGTWKPWEEGDSPPIWAEQADKCDANALDPLDP